MSNSIDRSRTCPFLLRCFLRPNAHSEVQLFNPSNPAQQRAEYSIYVWKDTNLRELAILLRSVNPSVLGKGNARFSVRHVYPASPSSSSSRAKAEWDHRDLGVVFARDLTGKNAISSEGHGRSGGRNDPSLKTLEQHRFIPGDFLEIAYMTPTSAAATGPNAAAAANGASTSAPGSIPSLSIHGRAVSGGRPMNGGGLTEADQAWGIAGEQRHRPAGRGAGSGGFSGGNRYNPLLSGRGGMSILGQSGRRRQSESEDHGRLKASDDSAVKSVSAVQVDSDAMED